MCRFVQLYKRNYVAERRRKKRLAETMEIRRGQKELEEQRTAFQKERKSIKAKLARMTKKLEKEEAARKEVSEPAIGLVNRDGLMGKLQHACTSQLWSGVAFSLASAFSSFQGPLEGRQVALRSENVATLKVRHRISVFP